MILSYTDRQIQLPKTYIHMLWPGSAVQSIVPIGFDYKYPVGVSVKSSSMRKHLLIRAYTIRIWMQKTVLEKSKKSLYLY